MLITVSCLRDYIVVIDTDRCVRVFYAGLSFEREYEIGFTYYLEFLRIIYSIYIILLSVGMLFLHTILMMLITTDCTTMRMSLFFLRSMKALVLLKLSV